MRTTIGNLLNSKPFHDAELVAGSSGLDNRISTINVIDAPSGIRYVNKGTLAITSGYQWLNDPNTQEQILRDMVDHGAAGLAVKPQVFQNRVPDNLRILADDLSFPIIFLSERLSYAEFISFFQNNFYSKNLDRFIRVELVHEQFMKLVEKRDLAGIAKVFHDYTGKEIFCSCGDQVACSNNSELTTCLSRSNFLKGPGEPLPLHPGFSLSLYHIHGESENSTWIGKTSGPDDLFTYSFLVLEDEEDTSEKELLLIDFVARAFLTQIKKRSDEYIRVNETLLGELIDGNHTDISDLQTVSQKLGKVLSPGYATLTFPLPVAQKDYPQISAQLKRVTAKDDYYSSILFANYQNHFVILVSGLKYFFKLDENLIKAIQEFLPDREPLVAGVGRAVEIDHIQDSYQQSLEALYWAGMQQKKLIISFNELGILSLFEKEGIQERIKDFCFNYFDIIKKHDSLNNTELFLTLECSIKNLWRYAPTAKQLHLDPNTVKYRIKKIQELTNLDFSDDETRLYIENALYLADFFEG